MLLNACSFLVQKNADEASVRPAWWSPGAQWPWGKKNKRTSRRETAATHTPEGSHPRKGYMAHPDVNVEGGRD